MSIGLMAVFAEHFPEGIGVVAFHAYRREPVTQIAVREHFVIGTNDHDPILTC